MKRMHAVRLAVVFGLLVAYAIGLAVASARSAAAMAEAAGRFLDALTPEQRQKTSFPFESDERFQWHFVPNEMFPRRGLALKEMTKAQRDLAHGLLRTGLSARGYMTTQAVIDLETILKAIETGGRLARDPEDYLFSVFGAPSAGGTWSWRVGGHHVSLHFTIVGGTAVASSPAFLGANPAEVRDGPKKGLRVLAAEEDAARALVESLDASQRRTAIIADVAPNDIVTTNAIRVDPLSPVGVRASVLSSSQRDLLMRLVEVYTSVMADDIAASRLERLRQAGIENIAFAWAGEVERGRKHYYRVQGPTFLVEYDNTQNDGNHIHSVWRDFDGDFGRDLLREHLQTVAHR